MAKKVFEISAMVSYTLVIAADSIEAALEHVKNWKGEWAANADLYEVCDIKVVAEREPRTIDLEDECHIVI